MGIDFTEILLILVVALMVYGRNLPEAARKLGASYVQFRRKIQDVKRDFSREMNASGVVSEVKGVLDIARKEALPPIDVSPISVNDLETGVADPYRDADRPADPPAAESKPEITPPPAPPPKPTDSPP